MITHPQLPELAGTFFARFSRFEYALKNTRFRKSERNDGVSAYWNSFAREPQFANMFSQFKKNPVTAYIINSPPKKRELKESVLGWRKVKKPVNMIELTEAIGRVRNNLFHGDKSNPNLARNVDLLNAAIAIMDAMLAAHDEVRMEYEINQEIA